MAENASRDLSSYEKYTIVWLENLNYITKKGKKIINYPIERSGIKKTIPSSWGERVAAAFFYYIILSEGLGEGNERIHLGRIIVNGLFIDDNGGHRKHFGSMHIELLWLVPVFAFGAFLFIIAFYAQRRSEERVKKRDLSKEVAMFNAGYQQQFTTASGDDRLKEMEKTINYVAESFANQQRSMQDLHKESTVYTNEINELKEKLRTIFKEYDIVLSENFALRAKVKQLTKQVQDQNIAGDDTGSQVPVFDPFLTGAPLSHKTDSTMQFYDDTRYINLAGIDGNEVSESIDPKAG